MPNRRTKVRFDVFAGYTVHVIFAADVERTGRRLHADLSGARAGYITGGDGESWLVLEAAPDEATVAHESAHAVRELLGHHGANLDDETFAYHLEFLVGRIHRFLKRTS